MARHKKVRDHHRQPFVQPNLVSRPPTPGEIRLSKMRLTDWSKMSHNTFLGRIYTLLDEHINDSSMNVNWLANQLMINRKTLYRKVQGLIQLAPAELIRRYRMRRATELLEDGHMVIETAYSVGFNTASHFTTVFKEFYQQTPTEFIACQQEHRI